MSLDSLIPSPAAGFDMPLAMLTACHQRILQFCTILERLVAHIERHGVDLQAEETAKLIVRYFSSAGKHHHQDEEQDLFPVLRQSDPNINTLLAHLIETHQQLDATWEQLAPLLESLHTATVDDLHVISYNFAKQSREHVQFENRELLPRAATLLSSSEQANLGVSMALRRGIQHIPATKF